ncbi:hypothetical protein HY387_01610 [Candidatus Daviesbacteria bacterium]|nr:hypothetical protein [Candidatus Daviesbacteria bacterium]
MEIPRNLKEFANSKPSRVGLAVGTALSLGYDVLASQVEAAGPCKSLATRLVREFEDIGGVKDQYDSVIDKALGVIPGARVRYLVGGQVFEVVTDQNGYSERMIEAPCTQGNRIVASSEVITTDGRKVEDVVILQNNRKENFRTWVVRRMGVAAPIPTVVPTRVPESPQAPKPELPTAPVYSTRNPWLVAMENWWMLPAAILAGVGLIAAARAWRRNRRPSARQQP